MDETTASRTAPRIAAIWYSGHFMELSGPSDIQRKYQTRFSQKVFFATGNHDWADVKYPNLADSRKCSD